MLEDRKYQHQRARLVDALRHKGIADERVLAALGRLPRHLFIEPALRGRAYQDEALPIGLGQTISQPFTVAYQTALVDPQPGEKVLEVGTGSGYQAAVLCELGARVFSVERHRALYERTNALLKELGYRVTTRLGDGSLGWPTFAPYEAILVTAGATGVPRPLLEQLHPRGGRLVIPVGGQDGQVMRRIVRTGADTYEEETFQSFRFVPLVDGGA